MKVLLAAINSKYIHTGLGIRYVGEYAKQQGHQVELIEETINTPILTVLEKLMAYEVGVYGFSVHIWNKQYVFRLISMLKSLRPEITIVLGGPEVSFEVEKIFSESTAVDYILQGEGEIIFSDLLAYLESKAENKIVPQHVAYKNAYGKPVLNGGTTVIEDLSILPFPYPDLDKVLEENRIVYYEATRGCPFHCAYCLSGITHTVRKRPLELVLRDMDRFIAAGAKLVKFVDRTYNLDERYFLPMMEHLAKADTQATFHFEIKADMLSEKVLAFLKNVPKHRFQLEIGIQSTHLPTLKAINRMDNWDRLAANVKALLSFGNMHIHTDLIAGLPYESLKEFRKSFDDVYSLHSDMLQLGFLKVLPGTQMRKERDLHDFRYMEEPPYEILATKYVPYQDMQFLKRVENVFEQTHNAGQFPHILNKLVKLESEGAFAFYTKLTNWWVAKGHYPQTHNAKGVAQLLYAFILDNYASEQVDLLVEILRYDVFCRLTGWQPDFLRWNTDKIFEVISEFWRDESRVKQLVPDYRFSSWRQIHKKYPVELFKFNPETNETGDFYVMVDCTKPENEVKKVNSFLLTY